MASIPLDTDVVFIEGGANDLRWNATMGSMSGLLAAIAASIDEEDPVPLDHSTYASALYLTLTAIQNQDWFRRVIFLGSYPNTRADIFQGNEMPNYIKPNGNGNYHGSLQRLTGKSVKCLMCTICQFNAIGGPTNAAYLNDGVHLSAIGKTAYPRDVHASTITVPRPPRQIWTLNSVSAGALSGNRLSGMASTARHCDLHSAEHWQRTSRLGGAMDRHWQQQRDRVRGGRRW